MAVERLPFELAKPSNDTYVTQASEIGYKNGSVEDSLYNIENEKLQRISFVNSEYSKYFRELYLVGADANETYIIQYLNGASDVASGTGVVVRITQASDVSNYVQVTYIRGNGVQSATRSGMTLYVLMQNENEITSSVIANNQDATKHVVDKKYATDKAYNPSILTYIGIVDSSITTAKIADSNITTAKVANGAITTDKIANNSVKIGKIPAKGVLGINFFDSEYTHYIKELYITGEGVDANETYIIGYLNGSNIASGTGVLLRIFPASNPANYFGVTYIRGAGLQSNTQNGVTMYLLMQNEDAITSMLIGNNQDSSKHVLNKGYATHVDYSPTIKNAIQKIPTDNIADGAITSAKMAANAVETANIKNGAVTSEKFDGSVLSIENIKNGSTDVVADYTESLKKSANDLNIALNDDILTLTSTHNGGAWYYFENQLTFEPTALVHITCKLRHTGLFEGNNVNVFRFYLSDGRGSYVSGTNSSLPDITQSDTEWHDIHIYFDPSYYPVYKGFYPANIWMQISSVTGETNTWEVKDLKIYQKLGGTTFTNFEGDTAKELLEGIDEALSNSSPSGGGGDGEEILTSPNKSKYILQVKDDGSVIAVPIVPDKSAFFGNSLIGSWGYGMAASDSQHDYYYLITSYIKSIKALAETTRLTSSNGTTRFEGAETDTAANNAITEMCGYLSGNEDLVVVQLGDNVNTAEKLAVFTTSCERLLLAIRNKCQKARVVWMGMWYGSTQKYTIIENACKNTGCMFIDFKDLLGAEANNVMGGVTHRDSVGNWTCDYVTNVVENSATNITVTLTYNNVNYTATIDVISYSLDTNTNVLTYRGEYYIICNPGVASHPGDVGMQRIAEKFIEKTGM